MSASSTPKGRHRIDSMETHGYGYRLSLNLNRKSEDSSNEQTIKYFNALYQTYELQESLKREKEALESKKKKRFSLSRFKKFQN